MKATIEESKYGFYITLEAETLEESVTIARFGLNRCACPETFVRAGDTMSASISYKVTPNSTNYIKPVWSKP